jgi:hypothetical protein
MNAIVSAQCHPATTQATSQHRGRRGAGVCLSLLLLVVGVAHDRVVVICCDQGATSVGMPAMCKLWPEKVAHVTSAAAECFDISSALRSAAWWLLHSGGAGHTPTARAVLPPRHTVHGDITCMMHSSAESRRSSIELLALYTRAVSYTQQQDPARRPAAGLSHLAICPCVL